MTEDLQRLTGRERGAMRAKVRELKQFTRLRDRKGKLRMVETVGAAKEELQHRDKAMRAFGHKLD
ncbi:hypothetical protein [Pelagibius sp. Alg239-R121]|uniref:hypothetical protein n=1 Tax=Pelagibius sp. Alg239-R121 TaxID=2993448 RepID=UPI0024A64DE9|nr:hypothetical protein [Pelagibius sp. Alg239-R121]